MLYVHLSPSKQELLDDYVKLSLIPGPVRIREPNKYHVIFELVFYSDLLILRNMLVRLNDYGFKRLKYRIKIDYWKYCVLQRNGTNGRSLHLNIQISPYFHMAPTFWQWKQQKSILSNWLRKSINLYEHQQGWWWWQTVDWNLLVKSKWSCLFWTNNWNWERYQIKFRDWWSELKHGREYDTRSTIQHDQKIQYIRT
jgi:hypothetical protein